MPPSAERKLAAILSADVVGYSRLMAEDEDETVRDLIENPATTYTYGRSIGKLALQIRSSPESPRL
jgi:hypothetical protein